jgi:hypothetical protein
MEKAAGGGLFQSIAFAITVVIAARDVAAATPALVVAPGVRAPAAVGASLTIERLGFRRAERQGRELGHGNRGVGGDRERRA